MSQSWAPDREPVLPEPPEVRGRLEPKIGSGAIRLNSLRNSNPTAITRPEMPAIREPSLPPERLSQPGSGGPISWADSRPSDPVTEQTGRATEIGAPPTHQEKRDRAVLLRMDGVHAGQVTSLGKDDVLLGRQSDCDVVIDDTGVSRHHARILRQGDKHILICLGARNGTVVQGNRVPHAELHDGDFVQLGPRVGFRYSITDEKQEKLLHKLYESSNRDALTGAYNRKHFDERLISELAYATRHRAATSLILFDIDHFKKVNDTFGHAAGDAVLRQVSGIVQSRLRTEDVFARIGGEEFAVLLRGVNLSGCARLAERLRTSVSAVPAVYDGKTIPVTISLGCSMTEAGINERPDELVRIADERLYMAKTSGRNRVSTG